MSLVSKVPTSTGAVVARLIAGGNASMLMGLLATNAGAAVYYVKIWWEGTGVAPNAVAGGQQPATVPPVPGTTIPSMTIAVPLTSSTIMHNIRISNGGRMWYWVTLNPQDADTTVITNANDQITFIYE